GGMGEVHLPSSSGYLLFFFQAEDGIRDRTVTGVQTCALPIFPEILVKPNHPAIARVVVTSDRGDARAKHVAAVNFKISYPTLSPQHDATQPARVALVNRSRRMDPASVVRQIERWRRPRSESP